MLELVMHHTYKNGRATDVSGKNNHGLAIATQPVGGPGSDSSLRFLEPASEVRVAPSPTLARLDAIQVRARFLWRPGDAYLDRRHNIVEGQLSFALFITPWGGLQGTILDATGAWRGPSAPNGTVSIATWHEVEMRHDGFSTLEIFLDGALVAGAYDVRGPVRGLGPRGLSVGHWPEPDHRYTFRGFIDDVKLAKRDIDPQDVLDPCCNDPETLDDVLTKIRADGFTAPQARAILNQVNTLEAEIRSAVADGDGTRAQRIRELANQGALALQSGSTSAVVSAATRTVEFMRERVSQAALEGFGQRAIDILAQAPFGELLTRAAKGDMSVLHGLDPLLSALCLPRPPGGGDQRPPGRRDRPDPEGDPDTDHGRPPIVDGLDHTLEPTDDRLGYQGQPGEDKPHDEPRPKPGQPGPPPKPTAPRREKES